jgi:hypothetical protein
MGSFQKKQKNSKTNSLPSTYSDSRDDGVICDVSGDDRIESASLTADLHFQFGDPPLESEELLLEGGLLALEGGDLLLDAAILGLLEVEMALPA